MPTGTLPTAQRRRLDAVLSGRLGVEAVREVVLHPGRHGVPERAVDMFAHPEGRLTLVRSKFKPGRKLTAYYRRETGGAPTADVAVTWHASSETGGSIAVMTYPADPAMPQLVRLADPTYLTQLIDELGAKEPAGGWLGHTGNMPSPHPIRYRPGQRHVLRSVSVAPSAGLIVKTDRHRSGLRATGVAKGLAALLAEEYADVGVAQALGFSQRDAASLWRLAPGTPLSHEVRPGGRDAWDALVLIGRSIRAVHDQAAAYVRADVMQRLPTHDLAAEAVTTRRAAEHIRSLLPDVGRQFDQVAAAVVETAGTASPGAVSVLHGDLKSDNILLDRDNGPGSVRFLDLDRACLGDPALDLGKFLADLRWWSASDHGALRAEGAVRVGYGLGAEAIWARAGLIAALFSLKFAARRHVIHDPQWAARVHAQVEVAASTLARAELGR